MLSSSYPNQQNPLSRPHSNSSATVPPSSSSYQNKPPPPIPQPPQPLPLQARRRVSPHSNNANPNSSYTRNNHIPSASTQSYSIASPSQNYPGRSPPPNQPLATPAVGLSNNDLALFPLFKAVDKYGTGKLMENELRAALVNGDFTQFDPHTVRMMIRMFDHDRDGTIGFDEFWYAFSRRTFSTIFQ